MQNLFEEKHTNNDFGRIKTLDIPILSTKKYGIQYLSYHRPKTWNFLWKSFQNTEKTWFLDKVCCCSFCQK